MAYKDPKYDEDEVNYGYLKRLLESLNIDVTKKINKAVETTKQKNYGTTPQPPYNIGDTWTTDEFIRRCIRSRTIGSFNMSDWAEIYNKKTINLIKENFMFLSDVKIESGQDGKIITFYQNTDPSIEWTTNLIKDSHIGDYWRKVGDDCVESFVYAKIETNPVTYVWQPIELPMAVFNTTKGTKTIFTTRPTIYEVGDLWKIGTEGEAYLFDTDVGTFVIATRDGEEFNSNDFQIVDDELTLKTMENYYTQIIEVNKKIENLNESVDTKLSKTHDEVIASVEASFTKKTTTESLQRQVTNNTETIENIIGEDEEEITSLAKLKLTQDDILLEIAKKVNSSQIIAAINMSPETIKLLANKIALEGYTTINNAIKFTQDGNMIVGNNVVTLNNQGIQLANGGTIVGENGLLSIFQFKPDYLNGFTNYLSFDYRRKKTNITFSAYIPQNFVISAAYIHIQHIPIKWYLGAYYDPERTNLIWGYDRNIKLYKNKVNANYIEATYNSDNISGDVYVTEEINGAFGDNGFTAKIPTDDESEIETITSINIGNKLDNGMNMLFLQTADDFPETYIAQGDNEVENFKEAKSEAENICSYSGANSISLIVIGYYKNF